MRDEDIMIPFKVALHSSTRYCSETLVRFQPLGRTYLFQAFHSGELILLGPGFLWLPCEQHDRIIYPVSLKHPEGIEIRVSSV